MVVVVVVAVVAVVGVVVVVVSWKLVVVVSWKRWWWLVGMVMMVSWNGDGGQIYGESQMRHECDGKVEVIKYEGYLIEL